MVRSHHPAWLAAAAISAVLGAAWAGLGPSARHHAVPAPPASDSTAVNKFMWYFPSTQTVHVNLSAALGSNNGGMNFNGKSGGGATITIPLGWKARMHFVNLDAIPHSAIVIANQQPLPAIPQTAAFGAAYTRDVTGGLFTAQTDDLDFKTAPAGRYILVCGVPGHGPSGMWIWFVVSAEAKAPAYDM